ncbi:MAG: hypothetical protein ACWGMZ_09375, partial [Thermoguttaceae bacterium]
MNESVSTPAEKTIAVFPSKLLSDVDQIQCLESVKTQPEEIATDKTTAANEAAENLQNDKQAEPSGPIFTQPLVSSGENSVSQSEPCNEEIRPSEASASQDADVQQAYILPGGIVHENDFDRPDCDKVPAIDMPQKSPVAEQSSIPSDSVATSIAEIDGEAKSSHQSAALELFAETALPAEPETSEQELKKPALSDDLAIDARKIYPSTNFELNEASIPRPDAHKRSDQLEGAARQADLQTRHGLNLAGRGAFFAARAEFIAALQLTAQALDAEEHANIHCKALAAGFKALKEADDFLLRGDRLEENIDLSKIIDGHDTPVLKKAELSSLPSLAALKTYFN